MTLRHPDSAWNHDARKWLRSRDDRLSFIYDKVKNWDCAIDCGAWAGWWTNALAYRFGEVWAFEPITVNAAFCRLNNPMPHVNVVEVAVSDHIGSLKMAIKGANYGQATDQIYRDNLDVTLGSDDTVTVQATTVDTFRLSPGFIKIDVDGMNYRTLIGAVETIKRSRPVICIETKQEDIKLISKFLKCYGYVMELKREPDEIWVCHLK